MDRTKTTKPTFNCKYCHLRFAEKSVCNTHMRDEHGVIKSETTPEAICREICRAQGIPADERVAETHGRHRARWEYQLYDVNKFLSINNAIEVLNG